MPTGFPLGGVVVSEASLTRRIVNLLKARGCWVFKVHGHPWQRSGIPDILACYGGQLLAIEVKSLGAKLTPLQERERHALIGVGALHVVAYTVEDVQKAFNV